MSPQNSLRLNKFISESGTCSRRKADIFIEQGKVLINGIKAKVGQQVFIGDKVILNGKVIKPRKKEDLIILAFNKPSGITCTTALDIKSNIIDYINYSERIFPIGRLDKDSQGLIFLTNNGDIVNKILRAGNNHEKEYVVAVNKPITDQFVLEMSNGVPVLGVISRKCLVKKEGRFIFKITLVQGMNRQIRRMCEYLGYTVTNLERIRIMNVKLGKLSLGHWRKLTQKELDGIFKLLENSKSAPEFSSPKKLPEKNSAKHCY
jgi:23S rRNA pseudouridine2604 synthase